MSLKRDMLVEAGIEDKAVIDSLMNAYGSGIENAKAQAKSELQAENDSLKQQLEQQSQALNDLQAKEGASEEVKQQLNDLQAKFEAYKTDSEANLAKVTKSNAIRLALKDVDANNSDDLAKFINFDEVELFLYSQDLSNCTTRDYARERYYYNDGTVKKLYKTIDKRSKKEYYKKLRNLGNKAPKSYSDFQALRRS